MPHSLLFSFVVQIQDCVDRANVTDARWQRLVSATPTIVQLQARIRGLLARKAFKERLDYLSGQNPQIVKVLEMAERVCGGGGVSVCYTHSPSSLFLFRSKHTLAACNNASDTRTA